MRSLIPVLALCLIGMPGKAQYYPGWGNGNTYTPRNPNYVTPYNNNVPYTSTPLGNVGPGVRVDSTGRIYCSTPGNPQWCQVR